MWIFEPGNFASRPKSWLEEGYMDSHKARMAFAVENATAVPDNTTLKEAVAFIRESAGILIPANKMLAILSIYPEERGRLARFGWGDTEVREFMLDVVANYMANTRWPLGRDKVDINAFISQLQAAAQLMGFETVEIDA